LMMSELRDKASAWKNNLPLIAAGILLLATAWLLFTGMLVAAVFVAFVGNPYAWAIALAIVALAYSILGGIAVLFAYRGLSETGLFPRRTMEVLQQDREWIRQEARSEA
ncbi:MAG: phage holin family protein, partial [Candidatus Korobacteraceae bacterium]